MKPCITFFSCLLISTFALAHTADSAKPQWVFPNYLKVSHGAFYVPKWVSFYKPTSSSQGSFYDLFLDIDKVRQIQFQTIAASYERRAYKNWYLGASYQQWKYLFSYRSSDDVTISSHEQRYLPVGEVAQRFKFKMADIYAFYKWNIGHKQHFINIGTGATYAWGHEYYITSYYINPDPPYDGVIYTGERTVHYWGITPYLGYDFTFLRNRINIGPDIRARYYINRPPAEYYFNFHLGVGF